MLRQETRRRLEWLGRERELIYKTLVLTGLRKGELASLTVGQLVLDADPPFLVLDAADEKNRKARRFPFGPTLPPTFANGSPTRQRPHRKPPSVPAVAFDPKHRKPAERNQGECRGPCGARLAAAGCRADACRPIPRSSPCRPGWSESLTGTCRRLPGIVLQAG